MRGLLRCGITKEEEYTVVVNNNLYGIRCKEYRYGPTWLYVIYNNEIYNSYNEAKLKADELNLEYKKTVENVEILNGPWEPVDKKIKRR